MREVNQYMTSNVDPFELERIRTQYALATYVAKDTVMRPVRGGLKGKCPFPDHASEQDRRKQFKDSRSVSDPDNKEDSLNVNTESKQFFCYGCQRGGDIFEYLRLMHGLRAAEAIEWLENLSNA
jgi:DNA primase